MKCDVGWDGTGIASVQIGYASYMSLGTAFHSEVRRTVLMNGKGIPTVQIRYATKG